MPDRAADPEALVATLVGGAAGGWDRSGRLPDDVLRRMSAEGLLCAEVPAELGGRGYSGLANGGLTAFVGSRCSSLRSVMTSQGMAAWTIQRFGSLEQQREWLARLTGGELAGVAFSEPDAGSDLSAMTTTIAPDGEGVIVDGRKAWVTVGAYADVLVVFGRYGDGAAAVLVPAAAAGVHVEPIAHPIGCRAAGHAHIRLDGVRLPAGHLLGGAGQPLPLLVTTALTYGRLSVAWGCVGILRACLSAAASHARSRRQFGLALAEHQLVARHLAELLVSEQAATRTCEHASRCWDERSPELVTAAVLAKHFSAGQASAGASAALQVLASAGAEDGHVVARAFRDAKPMEIIEGSSEICQLVLARQALAVAA
jgi:alkylation response protein AidB-like acyl-CoA dehydrogenase